MKKKQKKIGVPPKGAKLNLHICENDVTSTDVTPKIIFPKKKKKKKITPRQNNHSSQSIYATEKLETPYES